jgi:hypothetical protein
MTKPRVKVNNEEIGLTDDQNEAIKTLMEGMKPQPLMVKAQDIAEQLYQSYQEEEANGKECGKLLLEWTKDCFWGRIIADDLHHFDSTYTKLESKGHIGQESRFVYGDLDVGLWIEPSKSGQRRIIVAESYCTCADDNITIYIKDDIGPDWAKFRVVTAYPESIAEEFKKEWLSRNGWEPNYYDKPSLADHRNADWDYGYGDFRDNFHTLTWANSYDEKGRADGAYATETKIYWALWNLKMHNSACDGENMI